MSVDTIIRDGTGHRYSAQITEKNALKVSVVEMSINDQTVDELTVTKQYRAWLQTNAGSEDMNVDASAGTVLFQEKAEPGVVKWITSWRLIMHDTNMEINTNDFRRFGTAAISPGLTNGVEFYFIQEGRQIDVFLENVKSIGDFLKYADGYTNLVNAVSSQDDYLAFDFQFDVPIVLPAGSNDKIVMTISDDLSSLVYMRAIVRGYQRFLAVEGL